MKGMVEQAVFDRVEDGDKDKRKKNRRSQRRSKQNSSISACSSMNEIRGEASYFANDNGSNCNMSNFDGVDASNDNGFTNYKPTVHVNKQLYPGDVRILQNQHMFPSDQGGNVFFQSCPLPITCEDSSVPFMNEDLPPPSYLIDEYARRKHFAPHWPNETVNEALEKGDIFKATFRVNAHNKVEAYCTIDGVKTDVLISGIADQNRAVEGDIVAVKVDHFALWAKMKGSPAPLKNASRIEDHNLLPETNQVSATVDINKGKSILDVDYENGQSQNCFNKLCSENVGSSSEGNGITSSVERLCATISSNPLRRPTGCVVAIIEKSPRRDAIVGFLSVNQWITSKDGYKNEKKKKNDLSSLSNPDYIEFLPTDPKFPRMIVHVRDMPDCISKKLIDRDMTVEKELVAAQIDHWGEESLVPIGRVLHIFGRGGEIEAHIAAILFENAICSSDFSPESLACLPNAGWKVPAEELETRKDLRNLCVFTIDPSTATDLDDALSVERLRDGIFRVGVHIADVSYFVLPDTALDTEAQIRTTSVYMSQRKLSMLPPLLSENLGSLIPGVDRLTFSIFFDMDLSGNVLDQWIGRTVIKSCCKLSYENAEDIIKGVFDVGPSSNNTLQNGHPQLHGVSEWDDVAVAVKSLHEIAKVLKKKRFDDGALWLEGSKIVFLFDEFGTPYDSKLCGRMDSNFIVEELMLLANRTAAEVISRAFPDSALLRRHPEPNLRKLQEFEAFCDKHGLELDTSSSGQFRQSLQNIKEKLKNDTVLFNILISYALRPMQLAAYFCTGEFSDSRNEWAHYSLAVPLYTHFTSPLRRYPDIVVHRTLLAAIEAEVMFLKQRKLPENTRCFTGLCFDKDAAGSREGSEALSAAALKHRVPCTEELADVAAHCNERRLASRHVKDASDKLYMWVLLRKKQVLLSEARVLGLGPKFMSVYINKLAIERRIYYDEVEGLMSEWMETTTTLVLHLCTSRRFHRRGPQYKTLEDVAYVINPCNLELDSRAQDPSLEEVAEPISEFDPPVFPLTVRVLSPITVALYAIGGGQEGPLDIGVKLYMSSYTV